MKTLNQYVYSIFEVVSSYFINDDFPISKSWIEDQVVTQNQTLIRKAFVEKRIDEMLYMMHENVPVKDFDNDIEIDGVKIKAGGKFCYIDIPLPVTGIGDLSIDFVVSSNFDTMYSRTSVSELLSKSDGYYELPNPNYAVLRDKLLFKRDNNISKFITVNAIWGDPRKVSSWRPDKPFPTPSGKNLEILTVQHIGYGFNFPPDVINDAQRALSSPQQPKQQSESD